MKSYTDFEQSKKLVEILPPESADMSYTLDFNSEKYFISTTSYKSWIVPKYAESYKGLNQVIPCWSLAALLEVYPMCVGRDLGMFCCWVNLKSMCSSHFDNPVDACVDMILKLKERNLI